MKKPFDQWTLAEVCTYYMATNFNKAQSINIVLENVKDVMWANTFFNIGTRQQIYTDYVEWATKRLLDSDII